MVIEVAMIMHVDHGHGSSNDHAWLTMVMEVAMIMHG